MAKPGYGKRTAPDQRPRTPHDFALLPTRERYVAGFVDHLPEGAAMSVKQLAKQLPLYGQQAISTALTALSVAGHLRRVRCPVVGSGDETRWVFRTFWSRTAHDNEWWNTYLATEKAARATGPVPEAAAAGSSAPPPPCVPAEEPPPPAPPEAPRGEAAREMPEFPRTDVAPDTAPEPSESSEPSEPGATSAAVSVPDQRAATTKPPKPGRSTAPEAPRSPAYLSLAQLGHKDNRLTLSAGDCAALEAQAAEWFARGVDAEYLISALTAGLPAQVDFPVHFVRRRLADKMPPRLSAEHSSPRAPAPRVLVECTDCGAPGRPEALPDGLCRPCRADHRPGAVANPPGPTGVPADAPDVGAYIARLRDTLKAP
ncbi:MarR family transcriptional regulator [Streptomyces sp. NPDC091289]|uniref:MarR family transcriptional regulator n=1 Tax=Streptomyces sp. NPDC091289 TaxID=3365989 RepID=UPI00381A87ED